MKWKSDDRVLLIDRSVGPRLSPWAAKGRRVREAERRLRAKNELFREDLPRVLRGNAIGRGIYVNDPEVRHEDRWIPVVHWPA